MRTKMRKKSAKHHPEVRWNPRDNRTDDEMPPKRRFHRVWFEAIVNLLDAIKKTGLPADRVVNKYFRDNKQLGSRDHTFITEALYDILRNRRRLESVLTAAFGEATHENLAWIAVIRTKEWIGLELPAAPERLAAIHVALRNEVLPKEPAAALALRFSLPDWVAQALIRDYTVARAEQIATSLRERAPLVVRANALRMPREQVIARLEAEGIPATATKLSPDGIELGKRLNFNGNPAWKEGLYEVQDEGSQLIAWLAEARPGQKIVDACAGAGGKTLALAAAMNNRGMLYAFDNNERRLEPLKLRARRAGVHNIRMATLTGTSDARIERLRDEMDAVLVDAPCSGSGVLRRNPDAADRIGPGFVQELRATQLALLHAWARTVKQGGRLVYATCSVLSDENESVVDEFLAKHPEFSLMHAGEVLARQGIRLPGEHRTMRLLPDTHNTDGFFGAVMVRGS